MDHPGRKPRQNPLIFGFLGSMTAVICMLVPIELKEGYFLDLRMVPLVICLLYGGWGAGMLAAAALLLFRFYQGGTAVPVALFEIACACSGYLTLSRSYSRWSVPVKITMAVAFSCGLSAAAMLYAWRFHPDLLANTQHAVLLLQFSAIQCVSVWVVTYFIELIKKNVAIRVVLEKSKKMQLVSELAASVSHEVRNPLTVTRGFVQMLKRDGIPAEKRENYIQLALEELDRAESIISDFLSFAKPQLCHSEILHVIQEIQYVANIMTPYATMNQVDIQLEADEACRIRGEKDKFRQCLVNLAKNAIEAMPAGGTLSLAAVRNRSKVTIRLSDNGMGMTEEQISRLGTPYYSTKDRGTGLGTMMVYSIIQAMNGHIEVESNVGTGTSFILTFSAV